MENRESFQSRLGFILISAGCAIGIGNVWKFPYMVGQFGGGMFVLFYLFFLISVGVPIMTMEFAVGRASRKSSVQAFRTLEPARTHWHWNGWLGMAGNYILMFFYTTVSGWMLYYLYKTASGGFVGLDAAGVGAVFGGMLMDPVTMGGYMIAVVLLCGGICYLGVQAGVERITKWMMLALLVLMVILAINSILLPGSGEGLRYYLYPDFGKLQEYGLKEVIFAAMGQAFFTLSIGIGALAVFGSYIGKSKRLTGEAVWVIVLDTFVAIMAGLIIFPACFSYGVNPDSGPNLLFVAMPNVFNAMPFGRLWGSLFFLFMTFAATSTVIAVFENLIVCFFELLHKDRQKIICWGMPIIILLSLPCVLGFNVWSGFQPFGPGTGVLDLEDFLVSNNLLPLGSLVYLLFCVSRYGWGWDNFIKEANTGKGAAFPTWLRFYLNWGLPLIVLAIFVNGYYALFFSK